MYRTFWKNLSMHFDSRSTSSTVHGFQQAGQCFFSFLFSTLKSLGACGDLDSKCIDWFFQKVLYREKTMIYVAQRQCRIFQTKKNERILKFAPHCHPILDSIEVSIPACHAGDPGSIPGRGGIIFLYQ